MKLPAAAAILLASCLHAQARDCAAIADPAKRLQCYDAGSRPVPATGSGRRPYEGAWAPSAKDCREPSDGNFRIEGRTYKGHESRCDIDRAVADGNGWTLTMSCGGEGETWKETTTYVPEPDGRLSTLVGGRRGGTYVRCDAGAAAAAPSAPGSSALTEWVYDAKARRSWSCDDFGEGKGRACLAFACDYKSPTMTFFGRRLPPAVSAETADGPRVPLPRTGTQEEKTFAREFRMEARTVVLDGDEHLARLFDGMGRKPIVVRAGNETWAFSTAPGKSAAEVAAFRKECFAP